MVTFDEKQGAGVKPDSPSPRRLVLCALPYTNNIPHIGNVIGSHLPADIFARFCRLKGYETLFIGGTDENGSPTEVAALELGITPKKLTDALYKIHKEVYDWFGFSYDNFSRTSLPIHHETTKEFFRVINGKGFVFEDELNLPYCGRCKLYLPGRYVEGECPHCSYEHARGDQCEQCTRLLDPDQLKKPKCKICGSAPEIRKRKHLFLDFPKLQGKLSVWIKSGSWRRGVKAAALGWINEGLKPRCITRDLKWGVPVPLKGWEDRIFYVWFDAPIGYISSTKEWAAKAKKPEAWKRFWVGPGTRIYNFLGKDNIPFHTIFWPGMLIAHGGFSLPHDVIGLQYCNYEGGKISKSKGWGVFCEKIPKAGIEPDVWRYYFTHIIPETKDTEFKWQEFSDRVNNELIGNLGNFVHRTLSFVWKYFGGELVPSKLAKGGEKLLKEAREAPEKVGGLLEKSRLREGLSQILALSDAGNRYFQDSEPWELVKKDKGRCGTVLYVCAELCRTLGTLIAPYLPDTSDKVFKQLNLKRGSWDDAGEPGIKKGHKISKPRVLFSPLTPEKIEELKDMVTKPTPLEEIFGK